MPHILIVEDEIIVAMFMEDILAELGYGADDIASLHASSAV